MKFEKIPSSTKNNRNFFFSGNIWPSSVLTAQGDYQSKYNS